MLYWNKDLYIDLYSGLQLNIYIDKTSIRGETAGLFIWKFFDESFHGRRKVNGALKIAVMY